MATLKNTSIEDTGYITISSGTTAQRPASPTAGMIRYNTEYKITEYYNGSQWVDLTTGLPPIVTAGLLLRYDAGDTVSFPGNTTTWYDISGNGRTGTLTNGPVYTPDKSGGFIFDAVDDKVLSVPFTFTPYCLDFWLYNNSTVNNTDGAIGGPSTYQTLISYGYPAGVNLGGWTGSATNEAIHIWSTSPSTTLTYTKDESIPVGYHNWVFNWNGSYYDIWVDGQKKNVYPSNGGHAVLQTFTNTSICLGSNNSSYLFYGRIFSFMLYGSQLTDTQVTQNFNAQRGRYGI